MDSDDISVPTRFEEQVSIFEHNPHVGVVGGLILEFEDDEIRDSRVRSVPESHGDIARMMRFRNPVNNVTAMFTRSALDAAGGYLPGRVNEDYSLFVRMMMMVSGSLFMNLQTVLVCVRAGRGMAGRRGDFEIVKSWRRNQKILQANGLTSRTKALFSLVSVVGFVLTPPSLKSWLYTNFLRTRNRSPKELGE